MRPGLVSPGGDDSGEKRCKERADKSVTRFVLAKRKPSVPGPADIVRGLTMIPAEWPTVPQLQGPTRRFATWGLTGRRTSFSLAQCSQKHSKCGGSRHPHTLLSIQYITLSNSLKTRFPSYASHISRDQTKHSSTMQIFMYMHHVAAQFLAKP